MHISFLDIAIMVLYLVFTLFIGYYVSKKVNGFEDFALGGRSFGPFALAATFGATNFSTWSMVGKPGVVYNSGISVVWIALNACACVLAAVVFVPIYRKCDQCDLGDCRYNEPYGGYHLCSSSDFKSVIRYSFVDRDHRYSNHCFDLYISWRSDIRCCNRCHSIRIDVDRIIYWNDIYF